MNVDRSTWSVIAIFGPLRIADTKPNVARPAASSSRLSIAPGIHYFAGPSRPSEFWLQAGHRNFLVIPDRGNERWKASDVFIKCLEQEGVEYVFGVPGEENLDFLDSLSRSSIKLILTRHEQGAGFMAATYGRHTGKTGVCLATLGPGATNW